MEAVMVERRSEQRRRSLLGARIAFGKRHCTMDCIVRNVSANGALVVFPHSAITPREFALHIPQRDQMLSAKVVWRRHDRAGVALSPMENFDLPADYAARIRALEAENRRLRNRPDPGGW
jgi:hypothetical protein